MIRKISVRMLVVGVLVFTSCLLGIFHIGGALVPNVAKATQPPPPVNYTVTLTRNGGDSTCVMRMGRPDDPPTPWKTTTEVFSYPAGTRCEVGWAVECPSDYVFDHWESNNTELHMQGPHGGNGADFTLAENTTATAFFVYVDPPRVINFRCHSEEFNPANTGCSGAIENTARVEYRFDSSDGNIDSLSGNIAEILCYDTTVSFEDDVLPWLVANPTYISKPSNEEGPIVSAASQEIELPWYSILTKPSYVTTIPRWLGLGAPL